MALLDVRKRFVTLSGRYDLVVDFAAGDYTDNGANAHINAGQKWLDLQLDEPIAACKRRHQKDVDAGAFDLQFGGCRAIYEVWRDDGTCREQLVRANSIRDLRTKYPKTWSENTPGAPLYYAENWIKLGPDQQDLSAATYESEFTREDEDIRFNESDVQCDSGDHLRGIIWMPPADKEYTITVWGLFFSRLLADDCDSSFWTEVHPDTLVRAALMNLEGSYRNTEGYKDWQRQVLEILKGIDEDNVSEMTAGEPRDWVVRG